MSEPILCKEFQIQYSWYILPPFNFHKIYQPWIFSTVFFFCLQVVTPFRTPFRHLKLDRPSQVRPNITMVQLGDCRMKSLCPKNVKHSSREFTATHSEQAKLNQECNIVCNECSLVDNGELYMYIIFMVLFQNVKQHQIVGNVNSMNRNNTIFL